MSSGQWNVVTPLVAGIQVLLSIGYSPWFRPSLLVALQAAFAERVPGTRLALHSAYSTTQIELLLKGTLQAGIIELPANGEGLEMHCVWHDGLVVALAENRPLASRSEIDRQDLANEAIIWIARSLHPTLYEYFLESCQRLGFVPCIVHEISTISELFDLVGAGAGIGFLKRSIAE
jgi:DNA-binding transcriptional LysR family regulator